MEIVLFILMLTVPVFSVVSFCMVLMNNKRLNALKQVVVGKSMREARKPDVAEQVELLEI